MTFLIVGPGGKTGRHRPPDGRRKAGPRECDAPDESAPRPGSGPPHDTRSECGPAPSGDSPGGILDLWESMTVAELTDEHAVCILGVELRVQACRPAARGGDFYVLEAARHESLASDGDTVGKVVIEVDRNRLVPARRADEGRRPVNEQ